MDEQYMTKMAQAFLGELSEIEKQAFAPLRFLRGGVSALGSGLQGAARGGLPEGVSRLTALGGKGAVRAGGIGKHIGQIYRRGASKAMDPRARQAYLAGKEIPKGMAGPSMWGGIKNVAGSHYGRIGAVAAMPVAAGYGVSKVM